MSSLATSSSRLRGVRPASAAQRSQNAPARNGANATTIATDSRLGSVSVRGVELRAPVDGRGAEILTDEALEFVAGLQRRFDPERRRLLAARTGRQARI